MAKKQKDKEIPKSVSFKFKESTDYKTKLSTGVFGGWTATHQLMLDFYVDKRPVPDLMIHEVVNQDGVYRLGKEIDRVEEAHTIREKQVCVLMDYQSTKTLHKWLGDKLKEYEKLTKEDENNSKKK